MNILHAAGWGLLAYMSLSFLLVFLYLRKGFTPTSKQMTSINVIALIVALAVFLLTL